MRLDRDFEPGSLTWPSILVIGWMTSCSSVFASVRTGPGQHWALGYLVAVHVVHLLCTVACKHLKST